MQPEDVRRIVEGVARIEPEEIQAGVRAARQGRRLTSGRIGQLRAAVREGRYRPPARAVAEMMLRELRAWHRPPRGEGVGSN